MSVNAIARAANRKGFSLTEMAIVLSVVGLVLGGIWGVSETVYRSYKVNLTMQQVRQVIQNIRQYYAGSGRPAGWTSGLDITNTLFGKGLIPSEMRSQDKTDTRTYHSMSNNREAAGAARGSFQVRVQGAAPNLPIIRIVLYGLDKQYCIKVGQKLLQEEVQKNGLMGWPDLNGVPASSLEGLQTDCQATNNQFDLLYGFRG